MTQNKRQASKAKGDSIVPKFVSKFFIAKKQANKLN